MKRWIQKVTQWVRPVDEHLYWLGYRSECLRLKLYKRRIAKESQEYEARMFKEAQVGIQAANAAFYGQTRETLPKIHYVYEAASVRGGSHGMVFTTKDDHEVDIAFDDRVWEDLRRAFAPSPAAPPTVSELHPKNASKKPNIKLRVQAV